MVDTSLGRLTSMACVGRLALCGLLIAVLCVVGWAAITPRYAILQRNHYDWLPPISEYDMDHAFSVAGQRIRSKRSHELQLIRKGKFNLKSGAEARHQHFLKKNKKANAMEKNSEHFEEATAVLKETMALSKEQVSLALPHEELKGRQALRAAHKCHGNFDIKCRDSKYRTMDGSCNNMKKPTWGRAASCLQRLLPPDYADGIAEPRVSKTGRSLPNARILSLHVHRHVDRPSKEWTHLFMQFGQFLDHDLAMTPISSMGDEMMLECCPPGHDAHDQCMPILTPPDDPFFSKYDQNCINFVRSAPCPLCSLGPRQQTNQLTAYIDSSNIYGNSENISRILRTFNGDGLLKVTRVHSGDLLPQSIDPRKDECSIPKQNLICFESGDIRTNQHPALTSFHIVFHRQHNKLATRLKEINPHWHGDKIYEEARRILGAQMQMITYNEFLPVVLGEHYMDFYSLWVLKSGFTSYNSKMEATIINEFTTAAFRFGHTLVDGLFSEVQHSGHISGILLRNYFFFPFELYDGQLEPLLKGMTLQPAQKFDQHMVPDVRNFLYRRRGNNTGLDLAAFNIQRGREHGLQGYTSYIHYCFGVEINDFHELDRFMTEEKRKRLENVYESVHDIDLFTGGVSETSVPHGVIGPTFACIVGIQFYHIKFGDRYYFEHHGESGSFSHEQLEEIKKTTFSKLICDNTHIHEIQKYSFKFPSSKNPVVHCGSLPDVDLSYWEDSHEGGHFK